LFENKPFVLFTLRGGSGVKTQMEVVRVPCLSDNYVWLLKEPGGKVGVVDPADAQAVQQALRSRWVWSGPRHHHLHHHHHHPGVGAAWTLFSIPITTGTTQVAIWL
jgi:hypothetical protein